MEIAMARTTRPLHPTASMLIAGLALLAASSAAQAAVDCAAPAGIEQRRACEAAAQGAQSLRRFRERTRTIYAIHMQDYAKAIAAAAGEPVRVAQRQ
jgi:hypothetical protein